jgi:non-heme chloroperoxidase
MMVSRFKTQAAAGLLLALVMLPPSVRTAEPVKVTVGKIHLHYTEQGQGEPVILLHGGQGDYRAWQPQLAALAPHYRVITYSRRYHYPNRNPLTDASHSALVDADDLARLIETLKLGRVHLVGTSYGAFIALAYAIKHSDSVRSMVLAEPPVHQWVADTARGAVLFRELVESVYEPAKRAFAAGDDTGAMGIFIDRFDGPGAFEQLPPERRRSIMENVRFFKALTMSSDPFPHLLKEEVRQLPMPVLVVRGADTDELHRLVTEELARLAPDATEVTIAKAGHGSPRQNPEAFNAAVLEFLGQQRRE